MNKRQLLDKLEGLNREHERLHSILNGVYATRSELLAKCDELQSFHDKALPLLEESQFELSELRVECDEARTWARQLYSRLEWWGGVCECGGIKETNDDAMKCATCGKPGWNRGWE